MSDKFVLVDSLETRRRGKPVFLEGVTGIGPKYTDSFAEAQKFCSKQEAMQSSAFVHPMCFFDPKPASDYKGAKS